MSEGVDTGTLGMLIFAYPLTEPRTMLAEDRRQQNLDEKYNEGYRHGFDDYRDGTTTVVPYPYFDAVYEAWTEGYYVGRAVAHETRNQLPIGGGGSDR